MGRVVGGEVSILNTVFRERLIRKVTLEKMLQARSHRCKGPGKCAGSGRSGEVCSVAAAGAGHRAHEGPTRRACQVQPRSSDAQLGLGGREGQGRGAYMNLEEEGASPAARDEGRQKGHIWQHTSRSQGATFTHKPVSVTAPCSN